MTVYSPAYTIGVPARGSNSTYVLRRWTWIRLFAELSSVFLLLRIVVGIFTQRVSPRNGVERALVYPAIGTVVGCWLGIIPIALDWDRPWQVSVDVNTISLFRRMTFDKAWPLTPAVGAIAGYIFSSIAALCVNGVVHMAQEYSRAAAPGEI